MTDLQAVGVLKPDSTSVSNTFCSQRGLEVLSLVLHSQKDAWRKVPMGLNVDRGGISASHVMRHVVSLVMSSI